MRRKSVWFVILTLLALSLLFSVLGIPRAAEYVLERSYGRIVTAGKAD